MASRSDLDVSRSDCFSKCALQIILQPESEIVGHREMRNIGQLSERSDALD